MNSAELWCISLDQDPALIEKLGGILDDSERNRAAKFKFDRDRMRWIVAHATLRILLARKIKFHPSEIRFSTTQTGKPFISHPLETVAFNLSHSGDIAIFAITPTEPVGVDTEPFKRAEELAPCTDEFLHPLEKARLAQCDTLEEQHRLLITTWCAKEAYLKAIGTGLSIPLSDLALSWKDGALASLHVAGNEDKRYRIHFPQYPETKEFCVALALPAEFTCPKIVSLSTEMLRESIR
ncbi:MAG: 4'-phosphopantetheinyl transferase superfamily protein [Chthoniobacterales bacterium]